MTTAKQLILCAAVAAALASPVLSPMLSLAASRTEGVTRSSEQLTTEGQLFRTPHEYSMGEIWRGKWAGLGLQTLAGLAAAVVLGRRREPEPVLRIASLLVGHALLLAGAGLIHGVWKLTWEWPFALMLSRTSPLALGLSACLIGAAVEATLGQRIARRLGASSTAESPTTPHLSGLVLLASLFLAAFLLARTTTQWSAVHWACCLLAVIVFLMFRRGWFRTAVLGLSIGAGACVVFLAATQEREVRLTAEEREFFAWASQAEPRGGVFIIPPGLEQFRLFARRPVYVDFKLYSVTPKMSAEWRDRMELVCQPDKIALAEKGWLAANEWDRTYGNRNTPARRAWLLRETGATFFVDDARTRDRPPWISPASQPSDELQLVYTNPRFSVYRLKQPDHSLQ